MTCLPHGMTVRSISIEDGWFTVRWDVPWMPEPRYGLGAHLGDLAFPTRDHLVSYCTQALFTVLWEPVSCLLTGQAISDLSARMADDIEAHLG